MTDDRNYRRLTRPATSQPTTESIPFLAYHDSTRDVELGSLPADSAEHETDSSRSSLGNWNDGHHPNPASSQGNPLETSIRSSRISSRRNWIERLNCCPRREAAQRLLSGGKTGVSKRLLRILSLFLILLGLVQILGLLLGLITAFFPGKLDHILARWREDKSGGNRSTHWPTDYTADIIPIRCHSHNDYWRPIPLISAIKAGCTSVEADVWLLSDSLSNNDTTNHPELYVGHSRSSLTPDRTLSALYINPLLEILSSQNPITTFHPTVNTPRDGVYDTNPSESLVLLIDFKTNGLDLWPVILLQLEPLRAKNYLTYFNGSGLVKGPLTVVATGNAPFQKVIANMTYRDVFFDAPLSDMGGLGENQLTHAPSHTYDGSKELAYLTSISNTDATVSDKSNSGLSPTPSSKRLYIINGNSSKDDADSGSPFTPPDPTIYTPFNSYYASTSLQQTVGAPFPYFNRLQRQKIQSQISGAHSVGLMVRYWDTPAWPISWRNYIWRELMQMGIDTLNVDDLVAASKGKWMSQGSFGKLVWGSLGW